MRTYILVSFVTLVLGIIIGGVHMIGDHPRTSKHTVGEDALEMILRVAILAWAAFLLWGQ